MNRTLPVTTTYPKDLSIIIPIFNEADSIGPLHDQISDALSGLSLDAEIIYVNDGSTDGSERVLDHVAAEDSRVTVIHFRRNYGQTAAMQAGMEQACGSVLVTLDGDLQNDPHDIAAMLRKLDEGADLVHGWRKGRQDRLLSRKVPSWIANRLIAKITGLPIHDLGCTLKAIREVAEELDLYRKCIDSFRSRPCPRGGATKWSSAIIRVALAPVSMASVGRHVFCSI
ncbi:MAG: glycosyltransferase family 2 protein [Pirellulaceae bacterium]